MRFLSKMVCLKIKALNISADLERNVGHSTVFQ